MKSLSYDLVGNLGGRPFLWEEAGRGLRSQKGIVLRQGSNHITFENFTF